MKADRLILLAALPAAAGCAGTEQEAPGLNVIYILADDLVYGDFGCYGQELIKTPDIDRLAKAGRLFTQHYAGCTVRRIEEIMREAREPSPLFDFGREK